MDCLIIDCEMFRSRGVIEEALIDVFCVWFCAFDLRFEHIREDHPLDSYTLALIRSGKRKRRIL